MTALPHQPAVSPRHLRPVPSPQPRSRRRSPRKRPQQPGREPHSSSTQPTPPHTPATRKAQRRRASHAGLATETVAKLSVNGLLSAAALMALTTLFPYYWAQHAKLQEVTQQVQTIEAEVAELKEDFNRSFDPAQASSVMRDQSGLLAPNQRRVVLTNQDPNQSQLPKVQATE